MDPEHGCEYISKRNDYSSIVNLEMASLLGQKSTGEPPEIETRDFEIFGWARTGPF